MCCRACGVKVWIQNLAFYWRSQTRREGWPEIRDNLVELLEFRGSTSVFKMGRIEGGILRGEDLIVGCVKTPPEAKVEGLDAREKNSGLDIEYEGVGLEVRVLVQEIRGI